MIGGTLVKTTTDDYKRSHVPYERGEAPTPAMYDGCYSVMRISDADAYKQQSRS